jgi:hypothetical protein
MEEAQNGVFLNGKESAMKSFGTRALIACTSLLLAAEQAAAQYGSPSLLPLPAVTAVDAVTASYNLPAGDNDPYGSVFTSNRQQPVPEQTPEAIIPGANGESQFQQSVASEWGDSSGCAAGCAEPCETGCGGGWFGGMGALVMGRNRANGYWTSFETNNNVNQLMNTQDAGDDWTGGWQFTGGYMFGGGGCAAPSCGGVPFMGCGGASGPGIGVTYWGLGQMNGFAEINSATNELSTPMNLQTQTGDVEINGVPVGDYWDNSASHRIYRNDRVNNFELNGLLGAWNYGRLTVLPFVGFRYFRFDERLTFQGLAGGGDWDNGSDWAALQNRMVNNLYGFQVGTYANYMLLERFGWFIGPKVGLYANQMNGRTLLSDGNGNVAYDIEAHKSDFSMLAEIDTGFTYFWRPNVFTYIGYRVVGVSNIALADNQYLPFLADEQGFGQVKENGSLILHGVMLGGGFTF